MTTPREHAELAARNAAVLWLYQRAADQACINATFPGWAESQQTIANLAEELETSPLAWDEFNKWCREGGV